MTDNHDVADSTDWLRTPLDGLTAVEAALRCQMCKDFYKTPMLTSCSHTFCSLCIRHALANDARCPLCRKSGQETQLRNNWSIEDAVEAFKKARRTVIEFARNGPSAAAPRSPKRKHIASSAGSPEPERKRLRSSARLNSAKIQDTAALTARVETVQDSEGEEEPVREEDRGEAQDETYVPEDGLVACPVCQTRMKQWQVFKHLDTCTGPPADDQPQGESSMRSEPTSLNTQGPPQPSKPVQRLAGLSYGLLKDSQLRKKLTEVGLSSGGSRQLLESRHREWVTIWNANCDSAKPKTKTELLQDMQSWERTLGAGAFSGFAAFGKNKAAEPEIKDKNFNGAAWAATHDSSFRDLIASARKSRSNAQGKAETNPDSGLAAQTTAVASEENNDSTASSIASHVRSDEAIARPSTTNEDVAMGVLRHPEGNSGVVPLYEDGNLTQELESTPIGPR